MWRGWKASGSNPFGTSTQRSGSMPEQLLGARHLRLGQHDHALAAPPPSARIRSAHARRAASARVGLDRLEHQQLGAVQVADDRHVGRDPRGGLVQRRQVVQVQHVGLAAPAACSARLQATT